jgi:hypothetical protein
MVNSKHAGEHAQRCNVRTVPRHAPTGYDEVIVPAVVYLMACDGEPCFQAGDRFTGIASSGKIDNVVCVICEGLGPPSGASRFLGFGHAC